MEATESLSILDSPEQLIGERVSDYTLTAVLGTGGMSAVYRGQHNLTGQVVAVKVLPPELALHKELKARFVEEARVLARLDHPNLVNLLNFTQDPAGRVCLVMQFVEGVTFEKMIQDAGRLPPREAVRLTIEVTRALQYAHENGIVHRDMKPSNVLVRSDGNVKVTDFGIAKIIGGTRMTTTGQTMGTVRYMSPEQVQGLTIDARSDIYSLGITLFEALSGDTPFSGEQQFEVMRRHVTDPVPTLRSRGVEVSADLEAVIGCALEKRPDDRFASAQALREALECVPEGSRPGTARRPVLPRAAGQRRHGRRLALTLALVAATGGVLGAAVLLRPRRRIQVAPPLVRPPTTPEWPPPHATLRTLSPAVDERFAEDGLRVLSLAPRSASGLRDRYLAARDLFARLLVAEKVEAKLSARPLNLAILSQAVMNSTAVWPDAKPGTDYGTRYFPVDATLYVADGPGFESGDLLHGLALHFCAPMRQFSNQQCYDLAERFVRYSVAPAGK